MFRRLALIAALMVVVAACQDGEPNQSVAAGVTGPQDEKLARLRNTDVCALLPRAELAKLGPVTAVGTNELYECEAKLGEDQKTSTRVNWSVRALDDVAPDVGATVTIEGLTVSMISDKDTRPPAEIASARFRTCSAFAQLPAGGSMLLMLTIPPGAEPCAGAQSLVTVALAEWKRTPRLGDSPDTVQTPVTGADPCAVLTKLPNAVRGDTQWVDRCWFELDGHSIYLEYKHATDREFENYLPVKVGGRQAYRTSKDDNASYMLRVGPTFDPAADEFDFANVPAVTINAVSGHNQATLEKVTAAVMSIFPNAA
ncbi:hypothetical protein [Nocardia vinacea]|uniref:hypothetical protein n=1 Tax=Nocardia vinacea TaxID=96468 RepID=UPI000317FDD5|nr:hypothetical protein [Nocardia vinacea]